MSSNNSNNPRAHIKFYQQRWVPLSDKINPTYDKRHCAYQQFNQEHYYRQPCSYSTAMVYHRPYSCYSDANPNLGFFSTQ